MRTNEDRITMLHQQAAVLYNEDRDRRFRTFCAAGAAVCICILAAISMLIPRTVSNSFIEDTAESMNASIFSGSPVLSYLVIAILAFMLGITVTVFCFRLKKYLDEKDKPDLR